MKSNRCAQAELVCAYAVHALHPAEAAAVEAHIARCLACKRELELIEPVVDSFVAWPTTVLRPRPQLEQRLAARIASETGGKAEVPATPQWQEPEWQQVAPGISCKLLATDDERHTVSMLVRLEAGYSYPAHQHAGREELHLLEGELWIDERKLYPGQYYRAEAGSGDEIVWSGTGCSCVLITSTKDVLR